MNTQKNYLFVFVISFICVFVLRARADSPPVLHSVVIDNGNVRVEYSKDFATCVKLCRTSSFQSITYGRNLFCTSGDHVVSINPVSYFENLTVGEQLVLRHGNGMTAPSNPVTVAYANSIYFVDDDAHADGNGSSWATAFDDLQDALNVAIVGDDIRVAAGTYTPSYDYGVGDGSNRYNHFRMINGVAIYGGFAGNETLLDQRDIQANKTILSGDLSDNDTTGLDPSELLNDPNRADNCYHVFYHPEGTDLDSTAILDGFTITAGNADGASLSNSGGGMYNRLNSPTVINCTFSSNTADFNGGGMYDYQSSPTVVNCTFTINTTDYGGGMYNSYHSNPTVTDCRFSGNTATQGGGMYNSNSDAILTNCSFSGNSATEGGGMFNYFHSAPTVSNCILWDNSASVSGNEIYNDSSTPSISYSNIQGCLDGGVWNAYLGTDGGGNMDESPLFVDADGPDNIYGTEDDNLQLQAGSFCIDAANGDVAPETDILGNLRYDDPGMGNIGTGDPTFVDIGAYEYQGTTTLCTLPDVLNRPQEVACSMIVSAGLVVGSQSYEYSEIVPEGLVIQQTPPAGEVLISGFAVDLVISKDPTTVIVPDITGKTQADAEAMILSSNLIIGEVTYRFDETIPEDDVINQTPTAGSNIASGSSVDLEVSLGRPNPDNYEACTPGFWKNHPNCWHEAYNEDMLISDVFVALKAVPYDNLDDNDRKSDFDNDRVAEALRYRGGPELAGAARNLLRHATTAVLNASNNKVNYPVPDLLVIDLVNYVLDEQDIEQIRELHTILKDINEDSPCPINAHGQRIDDINRQQIY